MPAVRLEENHMGSIMSAEVLPSNASRAADGLLSNALVDTARIERMILGGFIFGGCLLAVHRAFGRFAMRAGGRPARVFVELQRKAFHMMGGCLICAAYHWGMKHGFLAPAFGVPSVAAGPVGVAGSGGGGAASLDAGAAFLSVCLASWMLEASRLMIPAVQRWYLRSFKGLVREKERTKAAGVAYFLPGSLAAVMAAPSNIAILGILYLSMGDAAASIGTAAGSIPVGASLRKVEGSIGCLLVCTGLGAYAGLSSSVAVTAALLVTIGELLAEVIGLDDNLVIPILGVLGVRIGLFPQLRLMAAVMSTSLSIAIMLGMAVASTTYKHAQE